MANMASMGFGGPRSARLNQDDLRSLPTAAGVHCLVPGLTGWAPVHGQGALPIAPTVAVGAQCVHRHSVWFDTRVVWMTLLTVIKRDGVIH
jgi:O-antigen biosynthesis protein WbqP